MNIEMTKQIEAPISQVFEVFSDFPNCHQHIDGIERIEMLTAGPVGVGTTFKETRVMFGRESTEEMTVTAFQPDQHYVVEADSCGAHFVSKFQFSKTDTGTMVTVRLHTTALTLFAKLMSPISRMMAGTMKKMIMADVDQLKTRCESN
ncbi:MAG: SRPBCC family protein [Planctomycetota bacterium]